MTVRGDGGGGGERWGRRAATFSRLAWGSLLLAVGNVAVGFVVTIVGLTVSFGAVASVDPSAKAARLAEGISTSMNATFFGLVGLPIALPVAIVALVRARKSVSDA